MKVFLLRFSKDLQQTNTFKGNESDFDEVVYQILRKNQSVTPLFTIKSFL